MLCVHCGSIAKYKTKSGKDICQKSSNQCPAIRAKNSLSVKMAYDEGRLDQKTIYQKKSVAAKDRMAWSRGKTLISDERVGRGLTNDELFIRFSQASPSMVRRLVIKEGLLDHTVCQKCNINNVWCEAQLVMQLDHINGDRADNRLENLRFLCPNCHSQTDTYGSKNRNGKKKVEDGALLEALETQKSIRAALLVVGLRPDSGNYGRCYRLLARVGKLVNPSLSKRDA